MVARVFLRLVRDSRVVARNGLFAGTAASFDASSGRCEEGSCGTDHCEDCRWVFRRGEAAILSVERMGDAKKES